MKRIVFLLIFLLLLFHPVSTYADDSWVIENFSSNLAVQPSGVVDVVETISVDFRNTPQYGIYRDIPYKYEVNGKEIYTKIAVSKVLQNNVPAKYATAENNGFEVISIGDTSIPLTGRNVYTITYTVTGIVHERANNDELYWNVTGFNWPVEIEKAEADVTMPEKGISSVSCSEGPSGYTSACQSNIESMQEAQFLVIRPLAASEGLTISVNFEKGFVPILTAHPPLSYGQNLLQWPIVLESLVIILVGIGFSWYVWYKYTGDFWLIIRVFGSSRKKNNAKPAVSKTEFTAPENLRPAEVGVLIRTRAETDYVTATIIDLASRGFIHIAEITKKWQFGSVDYLFTKTNSQDQNKKKTLRTYERLLLDTLFYKRIQVKLSSLTTPFYNDLGKVKAALYHDVIEKKLFPFDPEKNRKKYLTLALLIGVFGICMLYVGFTSYSVNAGEFGIGLLIDSLLFLFVYRYIPRRTPYGAQLYQRSLGFKQVIQRAERYKQLYTEKETIFTEILPFAIMFGLLEQYGKKMEKFGVQPGKIDWYTGPSIETTPGFAKRISLFSASMHAAITAKTSRELS